MHTTLPHKFSCTVFQADCLDVLPRIPDNSVDVVFIDPPYNTGNKKDKSVTYDRNKDFARKNWKNFYADWDTIPEYRAWSLTWLHEVKRLLTSKGTVFVCGSFHNVPDIAVNLQILGMYTIQWTQWYIPNAFPNLSMTKMINSNQTLIWARRGKSHYYDKDAAKRYNGGKNLRDVWAINQDTRGMWRHPSKKPVDLVYRALDIASDKSKSIRVLDFFGGSGSTGEAAAYLADHYNTEIECILVERDPTHAQTCYDRVSYGIRNCKTISGAVCRQDP